ncbi:MAG: AMP-binding protein, partial [Novosphingobium sp.]
PLTAPHPDAPQQGALLGVPLFHGTGCFAWLNPALHAGRKVVLMHRWDATEALALIERERLTIVGGVPTIALQLVKHPDRLRHDLTSVRTVSYGGAAAPPDLIRWIRETFSNAVASHGWGMTETAALACTHSAEDYANRPTSCGPAVPVGEMQIRSIEDGAVLPAGEIGELWFKGPQVVKGYWNDPQATAETFIDGWVRTGDIARLDAEGFCYIVDRARDMVIRGGENIYCVEVENALHKHPDVVDAALLGMPHPLLGEEPVAVVALAPGATLDAAGLTAFAAGRLATFKVPARIHIWDRPLPRNANGKIIKRELKEALITPA